MSLLTAVSALQTAGSVESQLSKMQPSPAAMESLAGLALDAELLQRLRDAPPEA